MANEPITREEMLLNAVATGEAASFDPITREEMFLAKLGGVDVKTPTPITRKEQFLQKAIENAGSGGSGGSGSGAGGSTGGDSEGGNSLFGRAYVYGTFTPEENEQWHLVYHNLGEIPCGVIFWTEDDYMADTSVPAKIASFYIADAPSSPTNGISVTIYEGTASSTSKTPTANTRAQTATGGVLPGLTSTQTGAHTVAAFASKTGIRICGGAVSHYFLAGHTYKYILLGAQK